MAPGMSPPCQAFQTPLRHGHSLTGGSAHRVPQSRHSQRCSVAGVCTSASFSRLWAPLGRGKVFSPEVPSTQRGVCLCVFLCRWLGKQEEKEKLAVVRHSAHHWENGETGSPGPAGPAARLWPPPSPVTHRDGAASSSQSGEVSLFSDVEPAPSGAPLPPPPSSHPQTLIS